MLNHVQDQYGGSAGSSPTQMGHREEQRADAKRLRSKNAGVRLLKTSQRKANLMPPRS